jgi:phosphosulfolactate synthase
VTKHAFQTVKVPAARSMAKPRRSGLTMMVDWGIPLQAQADLLAMSGAYLDLAKLAVVSVRVYTEEQLRAKVRIYREHGVRSFIGGGAIERLYALEGPGALEPFLEEAVRVGIEVIEISDNYITLSPEERRRQIALARSFGLVVFGEIGSKHEKSDAAQLIGQARDCFDAGAEIVIVEGYELVSGREPKRDLIDALRRGIDPARTLYELPGPWISGINASDVQDLKKILIREFGPDVSLGNVMPEDIFETEMSRQGLGVVQPTDLAWK